MNTELTGIIITFILTVILAYPLGKYISKVYGGERTFLDFMNPVERFIFRVCGIDPHKEMNWKEFLKAMLTINLLWLVYAFFMFLYQAHLPLNPDGNPNMTPDLSFNTAISFLVNCNLQDYSGETGVTYLTHDAVVLFVLYLCSAGRYRYGGRTIPGSKRQLGKIGRDLEHSFGGKAGRCRRARFAHVGGVQERHLPISEQ